MSEVIYRMLYTLLAMTILFTFIYLNYAYQIEYFWCLYHMDNEAIDFCWFESIGPWKTEQTLENLFSPPEKIIGEKQTPLLPAAQKQGGDGFAFSRAPVNILGSHQIAEQNGFFLTLLTWFLEPRLIELTWMDGLMFVFYPMVVIGLFQCFGFFIPGILQMHRHKIYSGVSFVTLLLIVHNSTLSTVIHLIKELQIESVDSELFVSPFLGHISSGAVSMIWFLCLAALCGGVTSIVFKRMAL